MHRAGNGYWHRSWHLPMISFSFSRFLLFCQWFGFLLFLRCINAIVELQYTLPWFFLTNGRLFSASHLFTNGGSFVCLEFTAKRVARFAVAIKANCNSVDFSNTGTHLHSFIVVHNMLFGDIVVFKSQTMHKLFRFITENCTIWFFTYIAKPEVCLPTIPDRNSARIIFVFLCLWVKDRWHGGNSFVNHLFHSTHTFWFVLPRKLAMFCQLKHCPVISLNFQFT